MGKESEGHERGLPGPASGGPALDILKIPNRGHIEPPTDGACGGRVLTDVVKLTGEETGKATGSNWDKLLAESKPPKNGIDSNNGDGPLPAGRDGNASGPRGDARSGNMTCRKVALEPH